VGFKRHCIALGLIGVCASALLGCGTDVNTPPGEVPEVTPDVHCGGKEDLTGEGSTAQANAITEFSAALEEQCPGNRFSYTPSGSGAGVKEFNAGQVDIGGSDSPLRASEVRAAAARCQGHPALHLPLVFGPISVAYHVPGIRDLLLTPQAIAKIFSGKITTWNAPELAALNPGLRLPAAPIKVFYRAEDSGTTDNFQTYLGDAAPAVWTSGAGLQFNGKVRGAEGRSKSQGVAEAVRSTPDSITYDEASYATQAGLATAKIDSGAGPVALTPSSTSAAVALARFRPTGDPSNLIVDLRSIYSTRQPGVYPLVLVSYDLVCSGGYDPATAQAVRAFATIAAGAGQDRLAQAGYVPLPPNLRARVSAAAKTIS
jgi:phosphate transport system substrate-binding protein